MEILIKPSVLDIPSSTRQLFGRDGPLVVEIGIGAGRFLTSLASSHPDWNIIGVELSPESTMRTFRRIKYNGVTNARLFRGHAHYYFRNIVPPRSLSQVYINFPDPWPRPKYLHKRLLQPSFLHLLSTRLAESGTVFFTTDHKEYFHSALDHVKRTEHFAIEVASPPAEVLHTKYARKWQSQSRTFFFARLIKTNEDQTVYPPTIERVNMQHAILEGTLPDITTFEKQVHGFQGGNIVIREVCRSIDGKELLFLVHIEESDLVQEIIIEARPNPNGGTWVGLKRFGQPLYSRGIGHAIGIVSSWLEKNGMHIIHRKH